MKFAKIFILFLLVLFPLKTLFAQDYYGVDPLELRIYPFEAPYNITGKYDYSGMNQLVENSESWTIFVHETFGNILINSGCNDLFAFFFLAVYNISVEQHLPLGSQWTYQEAHRSVLGFNGVSSSDSIFDFDFSVSEKKVYEISDSELAAFHDEHPEEFIRAVTAGSELINEKSKEIRKNYFYSGRSLRFILPNLWLNQINIFWSMQSSSLSTINDSIDKLNSDESKISDRDFAGPEYTTWVYELFHSGQPYSARGTHPSGTGYDRYISYTDLSEEELDYLTRTTYLMLLNFVSPQMLGINRFTVSESQKIYLNFSMMTYLAPFGYTVDTNVFAKWKTFNMNITYHTYANHKNYFPGFDIELYRIPFTLLGSNFFGSILLSVWSQPDEFQFDTGNSMPGGMARGEIIYRLNDKFEFFTETGYKTRGWASGQLSLEDEYTIGLGINVLMY